MHEQNWSGDPTGAPETDVATLYNYLSEARTPSSQADWAVGFGHFDLQIAHLCGALWECGQVGRVAFTGGFGAGSADLPGPEAQVLAAEMLMAVPATASSRIVCETRSTNTGENVRFLLAEWAALDPPVLPGNGVDSIVAVATPLRLRRVMLTVERQLSGVRVSGVAPVRNWQQDAQLYHQKQQPWLSQLLGEFDRLRDYPGQGWINDEPLPENVAAALARVR